MKKMPITSLRALAIIAISLGTASAETVKEIVQKFESQKAEALAAYLAANASAPDAAEAEDLLVEAYGKAGEVDKASAIFQKRYDAQPKGAQANLQALIGGVIHPQFELLVGAGKKDAARALLEKAQADLAAHPQASQIQQFFDGLAGELSKPAVGDSMEIAFTATDGSAVDLAKMKGKVVLVDFWATWCGPCVAEMPNVIAAYSKFKDKGFEVVGISLDQDRAALDGFTKQNGMTWPQHFDGMGWQSELVKKFGIRGIPATFLIGKDGKIAASDLRGEELEANLARLLAE